ncbi:MAG: hypothetical protein ACOX3T_07705 [Bdellovibrionota bacterium]
MSFLKRFWNSLGELFDWFAIACFALLVVFAFAQNTEIERLEGQVALSEYAIALHGYTAALKSELAFYDKLAELAREYNEVGEEADAAVGRLRKRLDEIEARKQAASEQGLQEAAPQQATMPEATTPEAPQQATTPKAKSPEAPQEAEAPETEAPKAKSPNATSQALQNSQKKSGITVRYYEQHP